MRVTVTLNFVPPTPVPDDTIWSGYVYMGMIPLSIGPLGYTQIYSGTFSFSSIPISQPFSFDLNIDTTAYPPATHQLILMMGGAVEAPKGAPPLPPDPYVNGWTAMPGTGVPGEGTSYWGLPGPYPAGFPIYLPPLAPGLRAKEVLYTSPDIYPKYAGTWDVTVSPVHEPSSLHLVGSD
jgi:hypothetical protein